jgi:pyruvate ferredoxin oxidoreductase alpha subunit
MKEAKMSERVMLDGNAAASEALRLAKVRVIAAYPITPQSAIAEKLADFAADGSMDARYIRVESEHSAMSCVIGAQVTGVRAGTATSSVGLALMHEVLGVASGVRLPIVMPVVNRSLAAPWSLWCDHQDTMAERDSGWLQFYAENAQEVLDLLLMAYRIGEHPAVLTPVMVCMDGFFVSHCTQPVLLPSQSEADAFLPPYAPTNLVLDLDNPQFIDALVPPAEFSEVRYQMKVGFEHALQVIPTVQEDFARHFGRRYRMVDAHDCQDARAVLVTLGSMSGTARFVAQKLRKRGLPVGVVKIGAFRPFPFADLRAALPGKPVVGVLDRTSEAGAQGGPVWTEVSAALQGQCAGVHDYIGGLGGRDITEETIEKIFLELLRIADGKQDRPLKAWIDTRPEAMEIRKKKETR